MEISLKLLREYTNTLRRKGKGRLGHAQLRTKTYIYSDVMEKKIQKIKAEVFTKTHSC